MIQPANIEITDGNIIVTDYGTDIITAENLAATIDKCVKLNPGIVNYVLVIGQAGLDIQGRIRDVMYSEKCVKSTGASALLPTTKIARIGASMVMGFTNPPFPVAVFSNREDALEWLKSERKKAGDENLK